MKLSSVFDWRWLFLAAFFLLGHSSPAQNANTPVVHLELVDPNAAETLPYQNAIFWAEFRVVRTGDTANELRVFLNTQQGSARLGEDYWLDGVDNGSSVLLRAGQNAANVRLYPIDDNFYEGDETVFFHLIAAPYMNPFPDPYQIDYSRSSVEMVIHDNDPITTRLDITAPRNGQQFQAGDIIELRAQIIGPGNTNTWVIEFFDGDQFIGRTQPNGAIWWNDAIGGRHAINALARNAAGDTLEAGPIVISVGPGPTLPVVSIVTYGFGRTAEPCPTCLVAPAVFTVSRTGPTNEALAVYLEYDGTATPGVDYQELPRQVIIPAGSKWVRFNLLPHDDLVPEGPEIARATLVRPELATGGYIVSYYASAAMAVIFDDEPDGPEIRLDIVQPKEGAQFAAGTAIEISALAVWTQGEVDTPVQFYAGNTFIGQSDVMPTLRPTIQGLPSVHTIRWANAQVGQHALTARYSRGTDLAITSPPVNITVGLPEPNVVTIAASRHIAEESSMPYRRLPFSGEFTISRTGPTDQQLAVFLLYSGTAVPDVDYAQLPRTVVIPAGATSTQIDIVPINDDVTEGMETLVAEIRSCIQFHGPFGQQMICSPFLHGEQTRATVYIFDNALLPAGLAISAPQEGQTINQGESIQIEATAVDYDSYISRVEFWDAETMIGVSEIIFVREPDPGTPIFHNFAWNGTAPGIHSLTARAERQEGTPVISRPVQIRVGANQLSRVVITKPVTGSEFPADAPIQIVAQTTDPDGYVPKMEFFANGRKIAESNVEFIRPPDPGQPQTFTFVWRQALPGRYALTARATDNEGSQTASAPVEITVGASEPLPIVTVSAPDPFAVEPRSNTQLNTATFRIRRHGSSDAALSIAYSLGGMAQHGVDYERLSGVATIPAGQHSAVVIVRALADDVPEGLETVHLRLDDPPTSPSYRVSRRRAATAVISDYPWRNSSSAAACIAFPDDLKHLCFSAEAGQNFRIECTSDFRTWETLSDSASANDGWHFIDSDTENAPCRFYRLTPEPILDAD